MRILLILSILLLSNCSNEKTFVEQTPPELTIDSFEIANTTIRALHVVSEEQVWFAGSNGKWGFTYDGGKTWKIDSIEIEGKKPDFRSIALTKNGLAFLVSVAEPAAVFKATVSNPKWQVVYEDTTAGAFFDMVKFENKSNGILLGDPQEGCFHLATTIDGGNTWNKVNCDSIPKALEKEAPFAASNSNIDFINSHIWIGTGGKSGSRIYHSSNKGKSWEVTPTDMVKGGTMTGIYSLDFYDEKYGVIAGGNWDSVTETTSNWALTNDGGATWELQDTGLPYISCVQFVPNSNGMELILLSGRGRPGPSSMYYVYKDNDFRFSYPNSNYLSLQFANDSIAWLSGKNKIGRMLIKTKPAQKYDDL